eukprot:5257-Heterococcus_DN1.PRE.2
MLVDCMIILRLLFRIAHYFVALNERRVLESLSDPQRIADKGEVDFISCVDDDRSVEDMFVTVKKHRYQARLTAMSTPNFGAMDPMQSTSTQQSRRSPSKSSMNNLSDISDSLGIIYAHKCFFWYTDDTSTDNVIPQMQLLKGSSRRNSNANSNDDDWQNSNSA